jgi:hypothetical protein
VLPSLAIKGSGVEGAGKDIEQWIRKLELID